jgi:hypothetical protein
MAKVSESYLEIMDEFPAELRKPLVRLVDIVLLRLREEFAVKREDFEEVRSALRELAEAQKRTEERVEELAQAQKRTEERVEELAQAQKRTEERVEELAQAQKRTEERVEELAQAQKRTEASVGRLEEAVLKLAEAQRRTEENVAELTLAQKRFAKHFNTQIGALGARWGWQSEESFRAAVKGILGEDFGMHVERYEAFDESGQVFGRPEQIEIDILMKDAKITAIEIKSSMSKSDVYAFDRKVSFYESRHQVKVDRKIIITPMLDHRAEAAVKSLSMFVYTSGYAWGDEETGDHAL